MKFHIIVLFIATLLLVSCQVPSDDILAEQAEDDLLLEIASEEGSLNTGKAIQLNRGEVEFVSCRDTDNGNTPDVKGTMTVVYKLEGKTINKIWEDSCKFSRVIEHYCRLTTKFVHRPVKCENGCENGACV